MSTSSSGSTIPANIGSTPLRYSPRKLPNPLSVASNSLNAGITDLVQVVVNIDPNEAASRQKLELVHQTIKKNIGMLNIQKQLVKKNIEICEQSSFDQLNTEFRDVNFFDSDLLKGYWDDVQSGNPNGTVAAKAFLVRKIIELDRLDQPDNVDLATKLYNCF